MSRGRARRAGGSGCGSAFRHGQRVWPAALAAAAAACALAAAPAAVPDAHAQNVTFSTGQSEYYFTAGERPAIPLEVHNGHGRAVAGILSYTMTQSTGQGNVQSKTINSGSQRFEVREGNNTVLIDMGAVPAPSTLEVELSFDYNDGFYPWSVEFGPITAHVVQDPSEARNEPDPMASQAQPGAGGQQGQGQGQQGQGQQGQGQQGQGQGQGQQGGQQGGQQPPAPDPLDRLQNNQMAQDSTALRNQIQGQLEEEAGRQNRFAETLSADPKFAEQHRRMIDDGYSVASTHLDPSPGSDADGSFEVRYESGERGAASIQGTIEEGQVADFDVSSEYEERRMLDALREDPRFAEIAAELEAGGYSQAGAQFTSDGSTAEAVIEYTAGAGAGEGAGAGAGAGEGAAKQARIRAEVNGTEITAVSLEYEDEAGEAVNPAYAVLAAAVAGGIAAAAYLAVFGQGAAPAIVSAVPAAAPLRRADPEAESRRLIKEARRLHAAGDEKGAFAHAARAVRVLLSDRLGMDREVTNAEMAGALKARRGGEELAQGPRQASGDAAACLEVADMVEFARMSPGRGDFGKISSLLDGLLGNGGGGGGRMRHGGRP